MDEFDKKNRAESDFYATPTEVTKSLLLREVFYGSIWEPAAGNGAMSCVLEEHYTNVYSSDIRKGKTVYGTSGIDFLKVSFADIFPGGRVDNIITNPPFILASEFIAKAKLITKNKIAFVLRLQFMESEKRYGMFVDTDFPLSKVYVFARRVIMLKEGKLDKTKNKMAFAWYVWDRKHKGRPELEWII